MPPLRPAAFFCAVVPPCELELRDEPDPELLPPRLDAPDEFEILAARSFDMPLSLRASYCFSFLTFAFFPGIGPLLSDDTAVVYPQARALFTPGDCRIERRQALPDAQQLLLQLLRLLEIGVHELDA